MPPGFTKMYADRLDKLCKVTVSEAKDGDRVKRGHAMIAAGDKHMVLKRSAEGYYVSCIAGDKVSGHCPSVDVLFESVAKVAKRDAIGVLLTGMGRDGAKGLLNMKKEGAYTIGQDKQSSVVYGMPMVAKEIGAVIKQAPCQDIAGLIIRQLENR
jgi:two-component system chemotaxis response regulator CheB